jgi:hypothetical protein
MKKLSKAEADLSEYEELFFALSHGTLGIGQGLDPV